MKNIQHFRGLTGDFLWAASAIMVASARSLCVGHGTTLSMKMTENAEATVLIDTVVAHP